MRWGDPLVPPPTTSLPRAPQSRVPRSHGSAGHRPLFRVAGPMMALLVISSAGGAVASPPPEATVVVKGQRPPLPPGSTVPIISRDRWATVVLSLDRRGNPGRCRVVASNLRRTEDRWRACNQIAQHFRTEASARKGLTLPGAVRRTLLVRSMKSRSATGAGYQRVVIY